ncbi:hypothetical protein G7070_00565 [Propioniciclava coleopterorum]|uniref:YCII-related domain-containing protein n=1 Tax=Propioniciclava coleopterorum TaxID=2714937 RepID=A0A6G7Y2W7_9ACTN|nr:YciI family protein [Propioniciclava coleopterorum]QIK71049.1 hypothetical protein G7070_00565 [Propioniciclava coleopterorum]
MSLFAVQYTYIDDTARRDEVRASHRAHLGELADAGTVVLSGPLAGREGSPDAALIVVRATSEEDARARLAEDPFQVNGIVAHVDVRGWNPVLGELFAALG